MSDVRALFPSVPHEGGLEATDETLEEDKDLEPGHAEFLVRLMEATLTCNSFESVSYTHLTLPTKRIV